MEADTDHATLVAGVMVGDASVAGFEGVAPKANLHSAAVGSGSGDELPQDVDVDFALTANRLAKLSGAGVRMRAINVSAVRALQDFVEHLDGNTHITQFIDWSASAQDILYAVGWGNNDSASKRVPTDNYNGMTVAASQQGDPDNGDTVYRKFGSVNATTGQADFPRTSISLIAPGQTVGILTPGNNGEIDDGTSFAAPHVTGTVALLQAYDSKQMLLSPPNPRFGSNSQRHEVMKAVMMNSADKLAGVHGSTRDVLSLNGQNWLQSPAYTDPATPLDPWIGTGELNAKRAVQQLVPGEYDPGAVPSIGWDYQSVGGSGQNAYTFNQNIGGGYIAATLAWDRKVVITGTCGNTTYCEGDQFTVQGGTGLNNLDLYLMPANSNDFSMAIASSVSTAFNVEHIFFNIPSAGAYKLVVYNNLTGGIGDTQNYALAWWYGNAPPLNGISGDYNGDGHVNAADYVMWRNDPASFGGAGGYNTWRANFGASSGSGSSFAAVPEPNALTLLLGLVMLPLSTQCRHRR